MIHRSQLAAMGIHYLYYPLEYMFKSQALAGFKTIELVGMAPHFLMDHLGSEDTVPIRRLAGEYGLTIGCFTPECAIYPYKLCISDPSFHARSLEYFKRGIETAKALGTHMMLTNCIGGTWDEEYERTYDRAVKSLTELGRVAADNDITIAVETVRPEESRCITKLHELNQLLKDVDHPNIKAGLDTIAVGVAGESLKEWFECLGTDIVHTHFVDGRPYGHLVWGDGLFPLGRYIEVLNHYDYRGLISQEITDFRYFEDPAAADKRCFEAFLPYICQEECHD